MKYLVDSQANYIQQSDFIKTNVRYSSTHIHAHTKYN